MFCSFAASWRVTAALLLALVVAVSATPVAAQADADALADAALAEPATPEADAAAAEPAASLSLLELFTKGGWLLLPIALMSIVVVAVAIERAIGLRRSRVAPRRLDRDLRRLAKQNEFEPHAAYRVCERYPSAAARIVTAVLAKTGRPHSEVEAAAAEASQREADAMYANVRALNLAAMVTPLMGLLGTVWGMIQAFFVTAAMGPNQDKSTALSEGIYVALVTTFAGLAVAIPAAVLAYYFETRILRQLRSVERLVIDLLPFLEKYENRGRIDLAKLQGRGADVPPLGEPPHLGSLPNGEHATPHATSWSS